MIMSNPIRVLILEDRAADAELMLHELRQAGFDPHCQRLEIELDYLAALETKPDLILADWSLPQFSGLRALKLMNELGLDIPFVIVSGSIGEEEAVQAMREGADDYILKDRLTRLGQVVERELKQAEERREHKQVEEQIYYQAKLLASVQDAIIGTDLRYDIQHWNEAAQRLYGWKAEEILGHPMAEFIQNEYLQGTLEDVVRQITEKGYWEGEVTQNRRDGTRIPILGSVSAIKDKQGQTTGFVAVNRDITARKQAEEEIHQLNATLELRVEERTRSLTDAQEQLVRQEKLAVLGQLAGSVGHELRNPLGVINTAIYYLKTVQPDAGEKVKRYHAMIEQEVRNADKIIGDLLDFARVVKAERTPVAIAELVQRVMERYPVPPSVEVTLEIPADLPMVFADPRQMEQVLGNLVINACQAMVSQKAGSTTGVKEGGKLTVRGDCFPEMHRDDVVAMNAPRNDNRQQRVRIQVKDTGTGIAPENLKKLFEPLFTTKAKGIGLGLAVSKKLIDANDGRIEVQSEPGKGSTFTVFLPLESAES
jgi:PAS domain S-box-containing protein